MAPTRELAMQTQLECERFGTCVGVTSCCIYGGKAIHAMHIVLDIGAFDKSV